MHYLPDTDEQDAAAESYWPDGFKQVIRKEVLPALRLKHRGESLRRIYQRQYRGEYADVGQLADRLAEMVAIGAENGADAGFDMIFNSFMTEAPLPAVARYAAYLQPYVFSPRIIDRIRNAVASDYRSDETIKYAYEVGYSKKYGSFDEFIGQVANRITTSVINGADDMLTRIYAAFLNFRPLPPARRNPKRLKVY